MWYKEKDWELDYNKLEEIQSIFPCNWTGWCREDCKYKKLKERILFQNGIPVARFTEPIDENKGYCFHYSASEVLNDIDKCVENK